MLLSLFIACLGSLPGPLGGDDSAGGLFGDGSGSPSWGPCGRWSGIEVGAWWSWTYDESGATTYWGEWTSEVTGITDFEGQEVFVVETVGEALHEQSPGGGRLTNREKHEIHEAVEAIDHKVESIKRMIAA